jgi:HAD superfamily hydrolase (TIGR01493 family)
VSLKFRAVVFDVGYTLIDETRQWAGWARYLGVSSSAFMRELERVIADRQHHREVFQRIKPDFDLAQAWVERAEIGEDDAWSRVDLYPDVLENLAQLKAQGVRIGLAGNQPAKTKSALEAMNLPVDWIANSVDFGVEKLSPEFFAHVITRCGLPPEQIAYVGDRLDNDVLPAQSAGMQGVFLIRGPWGTAHANWPEAQAAAYRIQSLDDLIPALGFS